MLCYNRCITYFICLASRMASNAPIPLWVFGDLVMTTMVMSRSPRGPGAGRGCAG